MKSTKVDVLNGSIPKQLMLFFFPILFGSLFQQIYNTTDAIIVGNVVGKYALAAVGGTSASLLNLFTGFAVGISSGASVVIAQSYGRNDEEEISKAVHTTIAFGIILSIIISVFMVINARGILEFLKVPSEILPKSTTYLRVLFMGFMASLLFNMGTGILRATGDTKRPLYFLIIAVIANIVLDILFVVYFKMGVFGAAVATVLAQILSAYLIIDSLVKTEFAHRLDFRKLAIDKEVLKKILIIGIPAGIQSSLFAISNLTVQSSINFLGADYVAAWTTFGKVDGLYWMGIGSFGIAITTFVAQNFGAKQYKRVKDSVWICFGISTIYSIVVTALLYFSSPYIYTLFLKDQTVIDLSVKIMRDIAPFFVTYVALEILAGALRGIGDSIVPTVITLVGICALRIVWLLIVFKSNPSIDNVTICYPISWITTSLTFLIYYFAINPIKRKTEKLSLQ